MVIGIIGDSRFKIKDSKKLMTLLTTFHEFDGFRSERLWRKGRVIFFYRMAVYTTLELHGFFFFLAPTESKEFFSREFGTVDESFIEKSLEDAVECRLIHLFCFDEFSFEFGK